MEIDLLFVYVDDVRTSLGTHALTASYGDSFTFLYAEDVRTSVETNLSSTACNCDDFTVL
jgi:hypothetical protein